MRPERTVGQLLIWLAVVFAILVFNIALISFLMAVALAFEREHALIAVAAAAAACFGGVKALPLYLKMLGEVVQDLSQAVRERRW